MTAESNVIFYMRLIHELKAEHPNVPDEVVKETVIKFGGDKDLCTRELASHSKLLSRSKRKVEEGKFYAAQRGKPPSGSSLIISSSTSASFISSPNYNETTTMQVLPKCSRSACRENPYSKVFARRKLFYQKFCEKDGTLEEDSRFFSSSNLVWRRRQCSLCDDYEQESSANSASSSHKRKKAPDKNNNFITLNANIQPFAPFVIRHDSEGSTPGALSLLNSMNHLHLDSSGHSSLGSSLGANSSDKMEMSIDGGKVHYATSTINSEEGVESHLEVSLGKRESFITTTHTDLTNSHLSNSSSSSIFHLQYEEGGKVLNITSNFNNNSSPDHARRRQSRGGVSQYGGASQYVRPLSLNLNSLFAPRPSSATCTQTTPINKSPSARYNSLPNLNSHGVIHPLSSAAYFLDDVYQSNPADEEKRLAYTRALLTHQMEQYLKLDGELRLERSKLNAVREEIALMEERRNKKCLVKMNAQVKRNEGLEKDIKGLRYSCDTLAAKVTKITKGKIPLGETNIQFYQFLSPKLSDSNGKKPPVSMKDSKEPFNDLSTFINVLDKKAKSSSSSPGVVVQPSSNDQWACTECTFLNHPALNHCEECEMPRFALGSSENDALGTSQVFMGENNLLS